MRLLLAVVLLASLVGCANLETPMDDGYQVGDLGRTAYGGAGRILELQNAYCEDGDQIARYMLLLTVRAAVPGYPDDGLCTELIPILEEASRAS